MSRIKAKNTKPEKAMFSLIKQSGLSFEKHYKTTGNPDIAFPENKVAVFIDGEFWHGKDFKKWEDKLSTFWRRKIGENIKRDKRFAHTLRSKGWHVIRFWDKKVVKHPDLCLKRLQNFLKKTMAS